MKADKSCIFVNQIGYTPSEPKYAYIPADEKELDTLENADFSVVEKSTGKAVFTSQLKNYGYDNAAGESYLCADFSDFAGLADKADRLSAPGNSSAAYQIVCGDKKSPDFYINDHIYDDLYFSALEYFRLSRCGQGVCHTGDAAIYASTERKNVQGGWHDAGDYGRYVVAGAKTVMDLFFALDFSGDKFKRFDILDEVRFELEWMLQMQRDDGAVYHKISCYHFCAFINPQDEKDELVLAPVSTAATADFAGTLAYASAYYEEQDPDFAKTLLQAALKAQKYLDAHDDELYINPPEITTGGYGDRDVSDERYFALCALFARTKDEGFFKRALQIRRQKMQEKSTATEPWLGWHEAYGWGCVSGYGTEILLKNSNLIADKKTRELLKESFLKQAEAILETCTKSVFGLDLQHFGWGSNGALCDTAHIMMVAHSLTGNVHYVDAARRQIAYILGCNPLNLCYVTGNGAHSPQHPHHRPSGASGKVMGGMVVGGPCAGLHDEYAREHLQNLPPLKCYADAQPSYSTNEVAIYWNSAFVYLVAAVYFAG